MTELPRADDEVHFGMKFVVPLPDGVAKGVAACVASGDAALVVADEASMIVVFPATSGPVACLEARLRVVTYSEAGRPPRVSASAAFSAYGTLAISTRAISGWRATVIPSQRDWPVPKSSAGTPFVVAEPSNTL